MPKRIAIIEGVRTPMAKAGTSLKNLSADNLGTYPVKEVLARTGIDPAEIDEVIMGNVAQPAHAANIARVIALKAGLPASVPAVTIHRNCASGMESITTGALKISAGQARIIIAGGVESMSRIPLLYNREAVKFYEKLALARSPGQRIKILLTIRPRYFKPEPALVSGLTDPISGLIMGMTAEVLAKEFSISREEQDDFALISHQRAIHSMEAGYFSEEIVPVPVDTEYSSFLEEDIGPRKGQSIEALARLRPVFNRKGGTVTVGNSCQITDGAAALILMSEDEAEKRGFTPLGFLKDFAYAALDPERMGLGPVYATAKLAENKKFSLESMDLIEMNEAFAAQIIANERAFPSVKFAEKFLSRKEALGTIDRSRLNVNGGAIALGHPVGMTGTRIVIHLLKELKRRGEHQGLATLCVGGGQGAAIWLEAE